MAVLPHECLFSFSLPATAKNFAFSYKEIWQLNLFRCCFRDTTFCTESQFFFFFFWSTAVLLIQLHRQKPKFCPSIWDGMSHYFHLKVFLCSESFLFFCGMHPRQLPVIVHDSEMRKRLYQHCLNNMDGHVWAKKGTTYHKHLGRKTVRCSGVGRWLQLVLQDLYILQQLDFLGTVPKKSQSVAINKMCCFFCFVFYLKEDSQKNLWKLNEEAQTNMTITGN